MSGSCGSGTDFDPGTNSAYSMGGSSLTIYNLYIAKYSNTGELVWAKNFQGQIEKTAYDIFVSPSGEILISGTFGQPVNAMFVCNICGASLESNKSRNR